VRKVAERADLLPDIEIMPVEGGEAKGKGGQSKYVTSEIDFSHRFLGAGFPALASKPEWARALDA